MGVYCDGEMWGNAGNLHGNGARLHDNVYGAVRVLFIHKEAKNGLKMRLNDT